MNDILKKIALLFHKTEYVVYSRKSRRKNLSHNLLLNNLFKIIEINEF